MPVLPFHRYIGPGNDINSGPCVDADDCIAKKHDVKYENAKTPQDVRLADVEAIEEFRTNWMSGNWHSLIGDIGLSLKYCVETYTGVIYPKLGNCKPCEIIPLFHNIIKLHCVNKERLTDRYTTDVRVMQTERLQGFTKIDKNYETFENIVYVLVMWYQLYRRSQERKSQSNISPSSSTLIHNENVRFHDAMTRKLECYPVQSSSLVNNCDIFNLNAWIRFFSTIQPAEQRSRNGYNDEDLSSMFMLYD